MKTNFVKPLNYYEIHYGILMLPYQYGNIITLLARLMSQHNIRFPALIERPTLLYLLFCK